MVMRERNSDVASFLVYPVHSINYKVSRFLIAYFNFSLATHDPEPNFFFTRKI